MTDRELLEMIAAQVSGLTGQVGTLTADMKDVKTELKDLKKTVLHIEQDHGKKLDALFDGYKQNSEQLTRIEKEVMRHDEFIMKRIK